MATITKQELEAQNQELREQLAAMQEQLKAMSGFTTIPTMPTTVPTSTDVTLVYTSDSEGVIKYSTGELVCTTYGEEFVLPRTAFDEIVGKYRRWFNEGILSVSSKNLDVAAAKKLPTDKEVSLTSDKLAKIGSMTSAQIETLWKSLDKPALKDSVIFYYKRKFIENAPGFQNASRVQALNAVSGGRLTAEVEQVLGRNYIAPTDLAAGSKDTIKVL